MISTNGYLRPFYGWYLWGNWDCEGQSHWGGFDFLPCDDIPEYEPVCGPCYQHKHFLDEGQAAAPDNTIAPWWNDWRPDVAGSVRYGRLGAGTSDDRFVVSWDNVAGPGGQGRYAFQVKLFKNGRFEFHYQTVVDASGGVPSDYGRQGSCGYQPRRGAHYGDSVFFCEGVTTSTCPSVPLVDASALRFDPDTTQRPEAGIGDPDIPDIVEDFAPDIYMDWSSNGTCDTAITNVNFDGDFCGANNEDPQSSSCGTAPYPTAAPLSHVYYSLSETQTHYFIGYYFYHIEDCNTFGHEHDLEGVNIVVRKDMMRIQAAFTNAHGEKVDYVPIYSEAAINHTSPNYGSDHTRHLSFIPKHWPSPHSRLAVGVEARTHVVWGRWDERCILGTHGAPSGCSSEKGGDGVILSYDREDPTPRNAALLPRPPYPAWQTTTYKLLPVDDLLARAANGASSGDTCVTGQELYRWNNSPWEEYHHYGDTFNSCGDDNGNLPWIWGRDVALVLGHTCEPDGAAPTKRAPNVLADAATIFTYLFSIPGLTPPDTSWENGWHWTSGGAILVSDGYDSNPYQQIDKDCCTYNEDPFLCYN